MNGSNQASPRLTRAGLRTAALLPLAFVAGLPWLSGILDNVEEGRTDFSLFEMNQLRYDRPGALTVLCIGGSVVIVLLWAAVIWADRRPNAVAMTAVMSVVAPLVLHGMWIGYVDPLNEVRVAAGLWLTTLWIQAVGLVAVVRTLAERRRSRSTGTTSTSSHSAYRREPE